MNDQIAGLFSLFLYLLIAAVVIRALLSWFPGGYNNAFGRIIIQVTEPLMEPVRRYMPRTGMIDLSAMVVIIILYVMLMVVNRLPES